MSARIDKWIVALRALGADDGSGDVVRFVDWARDVAGEPGVAEAEVEWLDAELHPAHSTKPVGFSAYASFWLADAGDHSMLLHAPGPAAAYRVEERLAFDRSGRPRAVGRWAGVKKTTFWRAAEGVEPGVWRARYRNHAAVARAHHATCMRYRQNLVVAGGAGGFDAVSELWWSHPEDLVERFYASDEARMLVGIDASGFVDTVNALPTVTQHEILRLAGDA